MSDEFLNGEQFSSGSPPSMWGCALFALVVVLAIVAISALCGGCLAVVRIPCCNEQVSDEGEVTNRVWTSFCDEVPGMRVYPTVKMRCHVTAEWLKPIPPEAKGEETSGNADVKTLGLDSVWRDMAYGAVRRGDRHGVSSVGPVLQEGDEMTKEMRDLLVDQLAFWPGRYYLLLDERLPCPERPKTRRLFSEQQSKGT